MEFSACIGGLCDVLLLACKAVYATAATWLCPQGFLLGLLLSTEVYCDKLAQLSRTANASSNALQKMLPSQPTPI